jgi:hypothetical protein
VDASEQTQVNYSDGTLTVKTPRNWRQYVVWSECGSVDVKIELPSGSRLRGEVGVGLALVGPTGGSELRGTGILGECTFKVGAGDIQLSQAGPLQLRTGAGDITVERASRPQRNNDRIGCCPRFTDRGRRCHKELQRRYLGRRG